MFKKNKKSTPEVRNWYKDRYQYVVVQRKILTVITLCSMAVTVATVIVISQLTPLKSVEPFVIQVDQKTGVTQTVDPLTVKELTANEAVNNYFIVLYIRSRESYNANQILYNYNLVRVMSEGERVYPAFMEEVDANNPKSNVARLGSTGLRSVKFKSITYLKPNVAQVRVLIEEKGDNIGSAQLHRIILIAFEYIKLQLTADDRYLNPLGFRVTDYRIDEDILQK